MRRQRFPNLPPLQSFNKQLMSTTIRTSFHRELQENSLDVYDFSTTNLFASYPQLKACFREVKVLSSKVWVIPSAGTSSAGLYTILIQPKDEISNTNDFAGLCDTPGAVTRKVYQPTHAKYYPTEPDERNWFTTSDDKHLFTLQAMAIDLDKSNSVKVAAKLSIQVIYDTQIRFRGRTTTSKSSLSDFEVVSKLDNMRCDEC